MRNESVMMKYWLRHYGSFCEKLVVYDDHSDDGSADMAKYFGAEVREYPGTGLDDMEMIDLAHATYPESRGHADWLIWGDTDEFVYHPRLPDRLDELHAQGINAPSIIGYSMFTANPPVGDEQIYEYVKTGLFDHNYSKRIIFDPKLNVTWSVGKHLSTLGTGAVTDDVSDPLKLLHYRWLGREYFEARNAQNHSRRSQRNVDNHLGDAVMPGFEGDHSVAWFEERETLARVCI